MDGRNRRIADIADRGFERLNWADSRPKRIASGRAAIRAIAIVRLEARYRLYSRSTVLLPRVKRCLTFPLPSAGGPRFPGP
jgi:hypothetical protein